MSTPSPARRRGSRSRSPHPRASVPEPPAPAPVYPPSYSKTEPLTKPHTVTVLIAVVVFVGYAGLSRMHMRGDGSEEAEKLGQIAERFTNIKTGIFAALVVGLLFCAEHLRDTLMIRPHPAIWRMVQGVGMFYFMFMAFLLFQDMETIQLIFKALDPGLAGKPVPERSYAEDCSLTIPSFTKACDRFLLAHFLGWFLKCMMLRDPMLCHFLSFLFEILEYLFTYLQPNFAECWWDHWILDFALCNAGGIILGGYVLKWLDHPEYNWSGFSEYPTIGGKIKRGFLQLMPVNITPYNWAMFRSFKRFAYFVALVFIVMMIELDAFFLKDLLWVPPESPLNVYRLFIWWVLGVVAVRDYYAFIDNSDVKRFGACAWIAVGALILEFLIVFKFAVLKYTDMAMPGWVKLFWVVFGTIFVAASGWWFLVGRVQFKPKWHKE